MSSEIDALRRTLGGHPVDAEDMPDHGGSETLSIALCKYFERHSLRPEDDPETDNGWGEWTELQAGRVLRELAEAAACEHLWGHPVVYDEANQEYRYKDSNELCADVPIRNCAYCKMPMDGRLDAKPDPCLGELPGVDSACCGHGIRAQAYIRFNNGVEVEGFDIVRKR